MESQPSSEYGPKLTDWANEPDLLKLKSDFQVAKGPHDSQMLNIQRWNDLSAVKGKAAPPKVKGRSQVQPKLIRRQAEWRYSALTEPFLSSNKLFKVSPVSWEDAQGAKQNELVLNWQFRTKLNRVKLIDDFVRATVDEGTSILRVGWNRITVKVPQNVPVYTHYEIGQEQLEPFQQALELKTANPQAYNETVPDNIKVAVDFFEESGQATYAVQTGTETKMVDKVVCNHPTVEVLNPQNFYIDPTCGGDVSKALFAIVSFETNKATLLKEPKRYPKERLDKVNWDTATPVTETDHATSTASDGQSLTDVLRKRVVAYEYWGFYDIAGNGVLEPIVVTWIGDTIIRMEKNPFPDQKLPFVLVPYLPKKREIFGEPDAELLEDNQAILGAVTRGMIDLLGRSANAQKGMAKGMLDALNKRRYESGEDYEFNPQARPDAGIIEHKFPEIPQSAMLMLNLQNAEAEALTGVKSFAGGVSGDAYGDVAAGIKGALDAAAKREMAILRRLAQGMSEVGTKISSMNAVFLSEKEVIRVTNMEFVKLSPAQQDTGKDVGDTTGDKFITVDRDDLAGMFDHSVDISTAEVDNAKAQDMAFMLQTMGPKSDPGIAMMILADIADLKRMPELAHRIRTFKPQPDPVQQQLQQLEIQKLQLEIEEIRSRTALNQAKAAEASSKKDKADLDFVEQESGVTHARDLEKQQSQARGNQDLAITKALVSPKKEGEKDADIEAAVGYRDLTGRQDDAPVLPAPIQPVDIGFQPDALPI